MQEVIIPFTVTAANLSLSDTADQNIYTFESSTTVFRVPKYLNLTRLAGDGYTVGNLRESIANHSTERVLDGTSWDYVNSDQLETLDFYLTYGAAPRRATRLFRAPIGDLNLKGQLSATDGTTTAVETSVLVFPEVQERFFVPGQYISLALHCRPTISGGTGNLKGQFVFDEYTRVS